MTEEAGTLWYISKLKHVQGIYFELVIQQKHRVQFDFLLIIIQSWGMPSIQL